MNFLWTLWVNMYDIGEVNIMWKGKRGVFNLENEVKES